MRAVARRSSSAATFNPVTYVLAGMRALSLNGWDASDIGGALLATAGLGAVTLSLAFVSLGRRIKQESTQGVASGLMRSGVALPLSLGPVRFGGHPQP